MSTSARVSPPDGAAASIRSVMALQSEVWNGFWSLYSTMWNDGVLDHQTKEIARMRNARTTDCGYCRQVRFAGAQDEGLGESIIDQIVDGYESGPLPEDRKILLRWVDEFLTRPGEGPSSVRRDLQNLVGADGEAELACAVALFRAFAKVVISLGLEPEPGDMPISRHATPGTTDPSSAVRVSA